MRRKRQAHGNGSIYKRASDGRWVGAVNLGDVGGKRVRRVVYGETQAEVVDKITRIREEHRQGLPVAADVVLVGDFLSTWLENIARPRLRPNTFAGYADTIRVHIKPAIGKLKLQDLTTDHVEALFKRKLDNGLSASTIRGIRAVLRTALQSAVRKGRLVRNVASLAEIPKVIQREIVPLSVEETRRLIESMRGHRFDAAFLVALVLGLRRGEILGLTWQAVDVTSRMLHVKQQLQHLKKAGVDALPPKLRGSIHWVDDDHALVPLKTAKALRSLQMPAVVIDALKRRKKQQARDRLAAGSAWKDQSGLVFTNEDGSVVTGSMITHAWEHVLEAAKLPKKRFHDARHGAGSTLLSLGVDLKTISAFLGHSTIKLTADTYLHASSVVLGDAATKLDKLYS